MYARCAGPLGTASNYEQLVWKTDPGGLNLENSYRLKNTDDTTKYLRMTSKVVRPGQTPIAQLGKAGEPVRVCLA